MEESHEAIPAQADQEAVETNLTPDPGISETFTESPPQPSDELYGRYEQMQADYTRKTQALAEQRREYEAYRDQAEAWQRMQEDPEFHRQVLETWGYELPADEEQAYEPEAYEPQYAPDPRVDMLFEAEQTRAAEQTIAAVEQHIQDLAGQAGVELTPRQRSSMLRDAIDDGDPQEHKTQAIFEEWVDDVRAQRGEWEKQWFSSKRGAPHVSPGGQEGSQRFDINDKDQRIQHMAALLESGAET